MVQEVALKERREAEEAKEIAIQERTQADEARKVALVRAAFHRMAPACVRGNAGVAVRAQLQGFHALMHCVQRERREADEARRVYEEKLR